MPLKKTIASTIINGIEVNPQKDIDMHPLEEKEIRSHWSIQDVFSKIPPKPNQSQEHEWLIENGADFVKLKRTEWQKSSDAIQPELKVALDYHQSCAEQWQQHVEKCVNAGLNPDITEEGKYTPAK